MDDLISRQQAIDKINERQRKLIYCFGFENDMVKIMDVAKSILTIMPSVQPERKTGRWIPDNTDYYRTKFICSVCGESEEVPTMGFGYAPMWGYCPNCGADMKGEQE